MAQQVNFHDELCEINRQQCELIEQQQETIKFQQNIIIQFQDAASTQKSTTKQDNSSHFQYMRIERQCFAEKKSLDVLRHNGFLNLKSEKKITLSILKFLKELKPRSLAMR